MTVRRRSRESFYVAHYPTLSVLVVSNVFGSDILKGGKCSVTEMLNGVACHTAVENAASPLLPSLPHTLCAKAPLGSAENSSEAVLMDDVHRKKTH